MTRGHISYQKLFVKLDQMSLRKVDLRKAGLSPTTLNKLAHDQSVTTSTIAWLCEMLNCQPGDIMEYVKR